MFPKPDVSLESGNLRQECATLLMRSFEKDKLDLTLVCRDGSRIHTSAKLVATISPLLRSFPLEKGIVSLDYAPQKVTSLLNFYSPTSWESTQSYMTLDQEVASLMVDLGIITKEWLLEGQMKMSRDEEERRKQAKEEEEKEKKEEELAKKRESEEEKIWEERLGRKRRREACQSQGMIKNQSLMRFHKFLQHAARTSRPDASMVQLQSEGKEGGMKYAAMLRAWTERLTRQEPLPRELLWDCEFCRYNFSQIIFKDLFLSFFIFTCCFLGSPSIAWRTC